MESQPNDPDGKRRLPARKNAARDLRKANPGMRHQQALNMLAKGASEQSPEPPTKPHRLADALGLHTAEDITARWAQMSPATEPLNVPVGVAAAGQLVHLNLNETAVGGSGSHGMLLGRTVTERCLAANVIATALRTLNPPKHLQVVAAVPNPGYRQIADTTFSGPEWDLEFRAWLNNELADRSRVIDDTGVDDFRNFPVGTLPRLFVIADLATEPARSRTTQTRYSDHLELIGRLAVQGRALGIHLLVSGPEIPQRDNHRPYPFKHNLTYGLSIHRTGHGVVVPAPLPLPNSVDDDVAGTPVELLSAESLNDKVNMARGLYPLYTRTVREAAQAVGFKLPPPATRPIGQEPT